jgi:hypothetical protein
VVGLPRFEFGTSCTPRKKYQSLTRHTLLKQKTCGGVIWTSDGRQSVESDDLDSTGLAVIRVLFARGYRHFQENLWYGRKQISWTGQLRSSRAQRGTRIDRPRFFATSSSQGRPVPGAREHSSHVVRMALGANRGSIVRLVFRGALASDCLGIVDRAAIEVCRRQTSGQSTLRFESVHLRGGVSTATLTLGLPVLVASLKSALRASLTSPLDALRAE